MSNRTVARSIEALHEELGRLPEAYRKAIVLCYFEGLTHEQAANRLRWPVGTVSVRLQRARKLLGDRLTRRGLAPVALLLTAASASETGAAVTPPALAAATIQAVCSGLTHHVSSNRGRRPGGRSFTSHVLEQDQGCRSGRCWPPASSPPVRSSGSFVSAVPRSRPPSNRQQSTAEARSPDQSGPGTEPRESTSPRALARKPGLQLPASLRDTQFRLYQGGEADLEQFLLWEKRFTDVIASEGSHQTKDFDPIRLLEAEVKGLQSLEELVKSRVEQGQAPTTRCPHRGVLPPGSGREAGESEVGPRETPSRKP